MFVSAATEPGSPDTPNEDWIAVAPNVAVVLDGVTVFSDTETGCRHSTPWYVRHLGTRLLASASDAAMPLVNALARSIREVAALHEDVCDLSQVGTPSAAVAVVRFNERLVDYLVLADVTVLFDRKSELTAISDKRVARTVDDLAGRQGVSAQVMERREQYRNQSGGYWVAASDPAVAKHSVTGGITRSEVQRVVMMSDGVTRLVSPFQQDDWRSLLELATNDGAGSVIDRVRKFESADLAGNRWPRFKVSDDASIVVMTP